MFSHWQSWITAVSIVLYYKIFLSSSCSELEKILCCFLIGLYNIWPVWKHTSIFYQIKFYIHQMTLEIHAWNHISWYARLIDASPLSHEKKSKTIVFVSTPSTYSHTLVLWISRFWGLRGRSSTHTVRTFWICNIWFLNS